MEVSMFNKEEGQSGFDSSQSCICKDANDEVAED